MAYGPAISFSHTVHSCLAGGRWVGGARAGVRERPALLSPPRSPDPRERSARVLGCLRLERAAGPRSLPPVFASAAARTPRAASRYPAGRPRLPSRRAPGPGRSSPLGPTGSRVLSPRPPPRHRWALARGAWPWPGSPPQPEQPPPPQSVSQSPAMADGGEREELLSPSPVSPAKRLCSWPSPQAHHPRGSPGAAGGGAGGVGSSCLVLGARPHLQPESLLDCAAKTVAEKWAYERVEERFERIPEPVQRRIVYWSFPRNEREICMYSSFQYRGGPGAGAAGGAAGASPAEEGPQPPPGAAAPAGSAPGGVAAGASPGLGAGAGAAGCGGEGLPFRRGIRLLDSGSVENVLQVGMCSSRRSRVLSLLFRGCLFSARALGPRPRPSAQLLYPCRRTNKSQKLFSTFHSGPPLLFPPLTLYPNFFLFEE